MTATFLQEEATTDMSCVIMMRVISMVFSMATTSSRICPCVTTSSAVVASSKTRSLGLCSRLMTIATR